MAPAVPSILLVEDDQTLGFLLTDLLESEGYHVVLCNDGEEGLRTFSQYPFSLSILDIMLPKLDGFHLSTKIKTLDHNMPIIFLTARTLKDDKLKGFALGADDYICKPIDEDILLCKIKAILNRSQRQGEKGPPEDIHVHNLHFSPAKQLLIIDHHQKRLTERENALLHVLFQHPNCILKREELLMKVWGKNDYFLGRSLDVFIAKLRRYLKAAPHIQIETIFGVGFMFSIS